MEQRNNQGLEEGCQTKVKVRRVEIEKEEIMRERKAVCASSLKTATKLHGCVNERSEAKKYKKE